MSSESGDSTARLRAAPIAGRYEVEAKLARGGMGAVYRVRDLSTGRALALKRLQARARSTSALFEREYQTLRSLKHPRIIEVHDYGLDADGAYYTMELLPGSDLHELAPVSYATACAYLRDIASSLALLHARRLLHRDLSPRNVRVTEDGRCKLIDFGALMSFGVASDVVGTPPCVPPEAMRGAPLDQRSDLYSLGATAYYLLTGRHAYGATTLQDLGRLWQRPPFAPSLLVSSIPPALDELVLSLLRQDPLARPASVAEVIDRLNVIASLAPEDDTQAAQGYLLGTALVGRDHELDLVQRQLSDSLAGHGGALLFEGVRGTGRSRLLAEACVRAQLGGATVLQVDADRERRENAVAIALCIKLLDTAPTETRTLQADHAKVLARLSPALQERLQQPALAEIPLAPGEWRGRVQEAFKGWLLAVGEHRPLVLAVDNLERADDASIALLAAVAAEAGSSKLTVMTTLASDARATLPASARVLRGASRVLLLDELAPSQTTALARAIFGELPNIVRLGEWMQRVAAGNPAHCLDLASELVRRGVVRYAGGSWFVPQEVALDALPSRFEEALLERMGRVSTPALRLLELLSLAEGAVGLELCHALGVTDIYRLLDELLSHDLLTTSGDSYRLPQEALRGLVLSRLDDARRAELHRVLAAAILATVEPDDHLTQVEAGFHLLRGGQELEGAHLLARAASQFEIGTGALQAAIPALEAARKVYVEHGRSLYELLPVVARLATEGYYSDRRLSIAYADEAFALLRQASGLGVANRLRPYLGRRLSMMLGLGWAALRFALTPRALRAYDFSHVFVLLVNCVTTQAGAGTVCLDTAAVRKAVDFIEPLTALGPRHITSFIHEYCYWLMNNTLETQPETRAGWRALLTRLSGSEPLAGFPEYVRQLYRGGALFAGGIVESWHDGDHVLQNARELETLGLRIYDRAASQLYMLYHAGRGEMEEAESYRKRMELHAVQTGSAWQVEVTVPLTLSVAYTALGDVVRLKHVSEQLAVLAKTLPSVARSADLSHATYLLLRGSALEAIEIYERVIAGAPPRGFIGWGRAVSGLAEAYNRTGRHLEALQTCERGRAQMRPEDNPFVRMFLNIGVQSALAEAGLGRVEAAARSLDALIEEHAPNNGPVTMGLLHWARARVALQARDRPALERHLAAVERWYRPTKVPTLLGRIERLAQEAALEFPGLMLREPAEATASRAHEIEQIQSSLHDCDGPAQRSQRCLQLLLERAGARAGYLFVAGDEGFALAAATSAAEPPSELWSRIDALACASTQDDDTRVLEAPQSAPEGATTEATPSHTNNAAGYRIHLLWSVSAQSSELVGAAAFHAQG
ncbi:MAG: protein kinase, partial [Polyangiales bacterium]